MTADAMQDAAFTAGDAADQFAAIGVHSAVMKQMVKKDLIQYIQDSQGRIILTTYLGKPIFMDDGLTYGSKQYLTMFFGTGAFGYGEGTPANPVGLQRDELGGNGGGSETIVERKTYILQPAGFSWEGEKDPNKTPTIGQYSDGSNWKRVFDRKLVPFAAVISGTP
ncbi:hypothetical protein [Acinetobacter pittii]|uniref:hypothetical protein n=2 Tax=Moraxellaceae TaxID=468 RepID=UPI0026DF282D|nr:hypothetical protein [Acinetobacter pittii]